MPWLCVRDMRKQACGGKGEQRCVSFVCHLAQSSFRFWSKSLRQHKRSWAVHQQSLTSLVFGDLPV
eukprot:5591468-Amphidinium_carterae.2